MLEAIGSFFFVQVYDGLGIALCLKLVSRSFQAIAQFDEIVDLSVENNIIWSAEAENSLTLDSFPDQAVLRNNIIN